MHRFALSLALAAMLPACGSGPAIVADDAWIRLPAVPGRPGAAYFALTVADRDDALVAVTTPVAGRTELHESMGGMGGMMTMRPLAQVPAKAGEPLAFAPGGRHVMLFDMTAGLQPGNETKITLTFASGRAVTTAARIVAAGRTPE